MTDVSFAMEAKSDQLNAMDLAGDRIIQIRNVSVSDKPQQPQPVSIYFEGDNNKPWKPSKGMIRVIARAWGTDSKNWIGHLAAIYNDPEVMWGGEKVGGIRIKALSGIDKGGMKVPLALNKQKRIVLNIAYLEPLGRPQYPSEQFEKAFPIMVSKMESGEMSLQAIFSQLQKTGDLTAEQTKRLEQAAPIEHDENEEPI
jgi:hypothetical protein